VQVDLLLLNHVCVLEPNYKQLIKVAFWMTQLVVKCVLQISSSFNNNSVSLLSLQIYLSLQ